MKKYRVYKQLFSVCKEYFCFRCKRFVFEQIPNVAQQVYKAFLFGENSGFAEVEIAENAYRDGVIVLPEVVNDDLETSADGQKMNQESSRVQKSSAFFRDSSFDRLNNHIINRRR